MNSRIALLRNVAMMSIASYAELAFGLILGVVIARSLGSTQFGHYAFSVWACGTLVTLINNAMTMSSIKFIAEARGGGQLDVAAALHARLLRWQVMSTAIVLIGFAAMVAIYTPQEWKDSSVALMPLIAIGAWSRSGYTMLASIGKGNERFEVESAALVLSALVNLLLVLTLSLSGGSLIGFFAIYAVCGMVQNLTARVLLRKSGILPRPQSLDPVLLQRLKRHLVLSGVLIVVAVLGDRTLEVLLLKAYSTSEAVGYFAIAGALTKGATYLLAGSLSSVLLPAMSRAFGVGGGGSVVRMLRESIRYYWFIGIAIAGMGITVAPGAVRLLYGAQYEAAVPAVVVNLMVSGLVLISAAFNAFQTSSDQQGDRIKIAALTLCVNVVAALALVPPYGLVGALGSLAVTKVASVCFSWLFVRRTEGMSMPTSSMVRVFLAAICAVAISEVFSMFLTGRFAFAGSGIVFAVGYLCCTVVLRAWSRPDFELVANVAGHVGKVGRKFGSLVNAAGQRFSA